MSRDQVALVVLPCDQLQQNIDYFVEELGFRLDRIAPADDPRAADLSGHGLVLQLRRGMQGSAGTLQILSDALASSTSSDAPLRAPNGTLIEVAPLTPALDIPALESELVVSRMSADEGWIVGRAGMRYRDLIPGRLGGRFIASHIQITEGGPVPDSVHFHRIRFQMIFCAKGWVKVLYEDQGPELVLEAGDCFLQPPLIRHRVLESSAGLEVIEVSCPAEHDTYLDHELELPTSVIDSERSFDGQRFVHHRARAAKWRQADEAGLEARDLDLASATNGLASARVVRTRSPQFSAQDWRHEGELRFVYVLSGELRLEALTDDAIVLQTNDSIAIPANADCRASGTGQELEFLEVRL